MATKRSRQKRKAVPRKPKPRGRPSLYTPELAEKICTAVATSELGLAAILKRKGMPSYGTVMRWLAAKPAFQHMYARAKEDQADLMAGRIVEIADSAVAEDVHVARLRVDARKWVAAKLKPRKYGERLAQEVSGPEGGPIQVTRVETPAEELTDDELAAEIEDCRREAGE